MTETTELLPTRRAVPTNSNPVASASTSVGTLVPGDTEQTQLHVVVDFDWAGEQVGNALQQGIFILVLDGDLESDGFLPFSSASREARLRYEVN